ncbi:ParB/RepB/Spo0J family partition protein [Saccharothrix sp. S26]|uniref:ParB/RepB/Spo0J family partition protein n=1 Tax=Saccharothrix sp. S26 TaxID=2907215 RepID=UPI001F26A6F8|nr:ParB/RepB/Spo0J family partition protein [Saccharothrix sp. S26]MCE6995231.1 ParB/RepB/Spo0J family partition protein [Saccharothrix sp. S26]
MSTRKKKALNNSSTSASLNGRPQVVPTRLLKPADSPRNAGENVDHVHALAEVLDDLPPILVHRRTMRVIDGMHRLRAALLRGDDEIRVRFFDGSTEAAFRLAVEANIAHGLPLTLAERKAAARRIIASYPHWADRAIAAATGLSVKTAGMIRRASDPDHRVLSNRRIGADGRMRPLSAVDGRLRAGRLIAERPDASLREIARVAGVSVGTAKDVRDRVRRGDSPVLPGHEHRPGPATTPAGPTATPVGEDAAADGSTADREATLAALRKDPSLRFTDSGRALLRLLVTRSICEEDWADLLDAVPSHTVRMVADVARLHAAGWSRFAEEVERRSAAASTVEVPGPRTADTRVRQH